MYLLTGGITSDTFVFVMPIDMAALELGLTEDEISEIIKHFEKLNLVVYDWENEEICVCYYFEYGNEPKGGLNYEMYAKDFDKVTNKTLIKYANEKAKETSISMAFFAALQDIYPEITEEDYPIRATDKTAEDMRNAAKRGRKKIKESRKGTSELCTETTNISEANFAEDDSDDFAGDDNEELPF